MRIGTLFSGIGAPEQGAKRVYGDALKMVFACEWDKFARQSFLENYDIDYAHFHKDIYDMNGTDYEGKVDILIGGSPCQAFSIAGLRKGLSDKRGELIYEYIRIVDEVKAPIIIYENVKGMLSIGHGKTIKEFVQALRDIGYHCHYSVINSKDYGVPQNRERLFLVGFLDVELYHAFSFAPKVKLTKRLRDVLENEVDEKYYLGEKSIKYITDSQRLNKKFTSINGEVSQTLMSQYSQSCAGSFLCVDSNGKIDHEITGAITARYYKGVEKFGGNPYIQEPKIMQLRRGFNQGGEHDICPTLTINSFEHNNFVQEPYRIRKLTPRECLRLQDFPDTFKQIVSDSQLYKQAGNSMTVAVLEMIFRQIEKAKSGELNSLFGSVA